MSITVNWSPVSGATGYTLYRSANTPVNLSALPADAVTVTADKTSYDYTTFVNNTLYYVVIAVTKADGTVTYSDQIPIGYYPDTGPGPSTLLRGEWSFGYFGEVSAFELFANSEIYKFLYDQYTAAALQSVGAPIISVYHKCIVAGRIVFIPDTGYATTGYTYSALIGNKLIVPDGDYLNKGQRIAKNGYEYILRVPHATAGPLNVILGGNPATPSLDLCSSELGMCFSLFSNASPAIPSIPSVVGYCKYKFNDLTTTTANSSILSDGLLNATNSYYMSGQSLTNSALTTSSSRITLILELLF